MAGITDFLFNGTPPPAVTTTSSSTTSMPQWWTDYATGILSKADALAATPYTPYPAPRQAPFDPAQQKSFDLTSSNVGSYAPYYQQAQGALGQAAQPFNQSTFNQFQSPYITGVVNRIGQLGQQDLQQNLLPAVNNTFTGAGQFGSSRNADFTNQAINLEEQNVLGQQAYALQGAQDSAMNAYNQAMQRTGQAGTQLGALGTAAQQAGLTDAASMNAIGQQQQQQTQGSLDLAYQDFLNQQNWPFNMTNYLKGTLSGITAPTSTTQVSQAPLSGSTYGPSPLASLTGALGLANSLGGLFSGSSGAGGALGGLSAIGQGIGSAASGIGDFLSGLFAEGGHVHPRRRRFAVGGPNWAAQRGRAFAPRLGPLDIAAAHPMPQIMRTRMPPTLAAHPMLAMR